VAVGVVDDLEVVEVDEQHGHRPRVVLLASQRVLDAVAEQRAVGELGQWVVERPEAQLLLEGLALGGVVQRQDEPADAWVGDEVACPRLDVRMRAVAADHAPLATGLATLEGLGEQGGDPGRVVARREGDHAAAGEHLGRVAEDLLGPAEHRADRAVRAEDEHDVAGAFDDGAQALLALAQRPLGDRVALPGAPGALRRPPHPAEGEGGEGERGRSADVRAASLRARFAVVVDLGLLDDLEQRGEARIDLRPVDALGRLDVARPQQRDLASRSSLRAVVVDDEPLPVPPYTGSRPPGFTAFIVNCELTRARPGSSASSDM
jgi:hypothetical protein